MKTNMKLVLLGVVLMLVGCGAEITEVSPVESATLPKCDRVGIQMSYLSNTGGSTMATKTATRAPGSSTATAVACQP